MYSNYINIYTYIYHACYLMVNYLLVFTYVIAILRYYFIVILVTN